jgi:hypothetical protein
MTVAQHLAESLQTAADASTAPRCPHCDQLLPQPPSGADLRAMRLAAGLTQRELGNKMGVDPAPRYQRGEVGFTADGLALQLVRDAERDRLKLSGYQARRWRMACRGEEQP